MKDIPASVISEIDDYTRFLWWRCDLKDFVPIRVIIVVAGLMLALGSCRRYIIYRHRRRSLRRLAWL
jgi:hypothetical protein